MTATNVARIAELRAAVWAKIRQGITRRAVSLLISAYVPPETRSARFEDGVPRLPLESIPVGGRNELLLALAHLQSDGE